MSEEYTQESSTMSAGDAAENPTEENQTEAQVDGQTDAQDEGEATEKSTTKSSLSVKATLKANQLVKNRYKFEQMSVGEGKDVYFLEANSMAFDRILRRLPREVNKNADNYRVPLGRTCVETVICAYGLSNSEIYNNPQWLDCLAQFNAQPNEENATKVIAFLRSAAYLKYLRVNGTMVNSVELYEFIALINRVNPMEIVLYFAEMVR